MSKFDWTDVVRKPRPKAKQVALYRRWRNYLKDSKLTVEEQISRAISFAEAGRTVPND